MIIMFITRNCLMVLSFIYCYILMTLIAFKNMFQINILQTQLQGEFKMKDLGVAKKILGMEFHKD